MKKKILGIFVCTLLIATTALPVAGTIKSSEINNKISRNSLDESIVITLTAEEYEIDNLASGYSEINMMGFGSTLIHLEVKWFQLIYSVKIVKR